MEGEVAQMPTDIKPPTVADLEALAEQALHAIPMELSRHLKEVLIRVEDFPDTETEDEMELDSPFELLGLYRGVAMTQKSIMDPRPEIDMIFLYRRPILDFWCETGESLYAIVRHVLIHEIGHHFGFSDDAMARLEAEE